MDSRKFVLALAFFVSTRVVAQEHLGQDLNELREVGGGYGWQIVEQATSDANQIRKNLEQLKLPAGFRINLFAVAPNAAHIAVSPQGVAVFVGTHTSEVWVITDRNKDRIADEVKRFAAGISFKGPSGVCFSKDGFLYVVEQNRVLIFPAAEYTYESFGVVVAEIVSQLVPQQDIVKSTSRACEIGRDNKLYIWLGQPINSQPSSHASSGKHREFDSIVRINRDGTNPEMLQKDDQMRLNSGPGTLFYTGFMFPERYRGGVFSIQDNKQLMFTHVKGDGPKDISVFSASSGKTFGRLMDLAQLHDGSILLSDELAGAIYRISFEE